MVTGYCVKCKDKREMKDAEEVISKNKMIMSQGNCEVCGCRMCKIIGKTPKKD